MDENIVSIGGKIVLHKETEVEFDWWGDEVIDDEEKGLEQDKLKKLPSTGETFRLIGKMRHEREPKSARPGVEQVIEQVGEDWRQAIEDQGIVDNPQDWFLSVSSLYRDQELEEKFKELPNSNNRSSHQTGAAFDIDPRGFYVFDPETEEFTGVNVKTKGSEELRTKLSLELYKILQRKHKERKINFFPEYNPRGDQEAKSSLGCYHCCLNPDYQKELLE